MKITYLAAGLLFLLILFFYLESCKSKQTSKQSNDQQDLATDTAKVHKLSENHYGELRNMALAVTPEQLQLSIPADQTKVFGVVMDWDLGEGIATFIAFKTGDASLYLSSGGGTIGGSGHESVVKAAKLFVSKAQYYLDKTLKTDTTPFPDKNCVRFYLLTNKGKFTAQEQIKNFDSNSSVWLPLFEEGNKVITEMQMAVEKGKPK